MLKLIHELENIVAGSDQCIEIINKIKIEYKKANYCNCYSNGDRVTIYTCENCEYRYCKYCKVHNNCYMCDKNGSMHSNCPKCTFMVEQLELCNLCFFQYLNNENIGYCLYCDEFIDFTQMDEANEIYKKVYLGKSGDNPDAVEIENDDDTHPIEINRDYIISVLMELNPDHIDIIIENDKFFRKLMQNH